VRGRRRTVAQFPSAPEQAGTSRLSPERLGHRTLRQPHTRFVPAIDGAAHMYVGWVQQPGLDWRFGRRRGATWLPINLAGLKQSSCTRRISFASFALTAMRLGFPSLHGRANRNAVPAPPINGFVPLATCARSRVAHVFPAASSANVAVEPAAPHRNSLTTRCVTNDVPEHDHAEGHAEDPRHHITH
jgi:hypothetical protein